MNNKGVLGLDVGSTYIKTARLQSGEISDDQLERTEMPGFIDSGLVGSRWVSPALLFQAVDRALEIDKAKHGEPTQIFISGQMHGATLCDADSTLPLVPISTWQDRAARDFEQGRRWHEVNESLSNDLLAATGNELDFGHPLVVLPFLLSQLTGQPAQLRFVSLISLVAEHLVAHPVVSHVSDAAASGMYDPFNKKWVPELVELAQIGGAMLPATSDLVEVVGKTANGAEVFIGVGDHQASLLGGEEVGIDAKAEISINVGTGAQVSSLQPKTDGRHRLRPKLGGGFFATIADLPAGRELSANQTSFSEAAQEYRLAADSIHEGEIETVALTGSIFTIAPEFASAISEAFDATIRLTKAEPALRGLARLAN